MRACSLDFSAYSSLRIGAPRPVWILELSDLGGILEGANESNESMAGKPSAPSPRPPRILEGASLHLARPLEDSKPSHLSLEGQTLRLIGRANNLLVAPTAKNLALLGHSFNYISMQADYIEMGASVPSMQAFLFCKKHDLQGLEFLGKLPGVLGALCHMNAGMKDYDMRGALAALNINGRWVSIDEASLVYRGRGSGGVILAARFHRRLGFRRELVAYFESLRKNQPKDPSCGSCFKNPPGDSAGRLLEAVGLKGERLNGVGFSAKHANFLVNLGGGKFEDAISLIAMAKTRVREAFGVNLECEVQICE